MCHQFTYNSAMAAITKCCYLNYDEANVQGIERQHVFKSFDIIER